MKTLTDKQQIKIDNDQYRKEVFVSAHEFEKHFYNPWRVVTIGAGTYSRGVCISAKYCADKIAREKAAYENAPLIKDGEHVLINGSEMVAVYCDAPEHVCDPIRFEYAN
jgi:hypothetical protein